MSGRCSETPECCGNVPIDWRVQPLSRFVALLLITPGEERK